MDILSLVGNTPIVELTNCSPRPGVRLFAKLEGQNPTGSIKDRIVARMLQQARAVGSLKPGQEIVEASTGNTGIALAMIGRRLGHRVRVVVPETVFSDIVPVLAAYGAEIEWVSGDRGIKSAIEAAHEIARRDGAFMLDQFYSQENARCHYETTGVEILAAQPDIDAFVCGLGTGGTITGAGRRLKDEKPGVQVVAAEPHPGSHLQGLRSLDEGFLPPILDLSLLDSKILVRSYGAFRAVREILNREGLVVGPSSGAVMVAALKWARRVERANIVLMFADSGWKYLNSAPFKPDQEPPDEESLDDILWW